MAIAPNPPLQARFPISSRLSILLLLVPSTTTMFQIPTFKIPFFGGQRDSQSEDEGATYPFVNLASVPIHDVETSADRRARSLKHLLKANHANHSILYNHLRFHNHAPHVCRFPEDVW